MSRSKPWLERARRAASRARGSARPPGFRAQDLVWIMGSPRTGSTWLLHLLARLTDGGYLDEPWIAPHLGTPSTVLPGWPEASARPIFDVARNRPGYVFAENAEDIWAPVVEDLVLRTVAAAVPSTDRPRMVFVKEPVGATGAPLLMRCLPGARLLFLVRDGRDVVDSLLDALDGGWVSQLAGITVEQSGRRAVVASCAQGWVRDMDAVQCAYDAHPPEQRLLVRYEDLRTEPVAGVERILRWLDRPVDPAALRDAVDRLDFDRIPEDQRGPGRFQRAARPGLWQQNFDDEEKVLLHATMGEALARYGYR